MKANTRWREASLLILALLMSVNAHGALINRGSGMIYDTVLNITWLQNANLMQTSGFDFDGIGNHASVSNWAANLEFGGYTDWRLPSIKPGDGSNIYDWSFSFNGSTDRGFNNASVQSELAYMFYVNLANVSFYAPSGVGNQPGSHALNTSFVDAESGETYNFENIGMTYWAKEVNNPFLNVGWAFNFKNFNGISLGDQQLHTTSAKLSGWAVRDGDVASTLSVNNDPPSDPNGIPEPGTLGLLFFGTAGFLALRRQSRR